MDIIIQSDFEIGDKVYTAELYDKWMPTYQGVIIEIICTINTSHYKIWYRVKDNYNIETSICATRCFHTMRECEEWCMINN